MSELGAGETGKGGPKYSLPVMNEITQEDVMYSMVTIVNNIILHI